MLILNAFNQLYNRITHLNNLFVDFVLNCCFFLAVNNFLELNFTCEVQRAACKLLQYFPDLSDINSSSWKRRYSTCLKQHVERLYYLQ